MKLKILCILALLGLLLLMIMGVVSAKADDTTPILTEQLSSGWQRLSPSVTTTVLSNNEVDQTVEYKVTATPTTLADDKTLIDNHWYHKVDPSGQAWFENGLNAFSARVKSGAVSVLDSNGRLTDYDPVITTQSEYKDGAAQVVDDPIYGTSKSALKWTYSKTLTRYLRSVNGSLSELWVISKNPGTDIILHPNISQESNFGATTTVVAAFDANWQPLPVSSNSKYGYYFIPSSYLKNATYPVYIDPTYTFNATYDGYIYNAASTYSAASTAASGTIVSSAYPTWIGQGYSGAYGIYTIDRAFEVYNTSTVPTNLTISSADIYLLGYQNYAAQAFSIYVCSGQPTYPSNPPVSTDYAKSHYAPDSAAGYSTTSGWSTTNFNVVVINNTGFIQKGGTTKLALMSDRDILYSTSPSGVGQEMVSYSSPGYLDIVGTRPVAIPNVTTNPATSLTYTEATLVGYLNDSGGANCSVQFQYGPSISYGSPALPVPSSPFTSGQTFTATIVGLSPGTVYHFKAQATNTAGTGYGSDASFTTPPYAPPSFSATPGAASADLAWTKDPSADKTTIVRKVGSAPTSLTDGTIVYSSTGSSYTDSPLTNGTTYYWAAWALAADGVTYSPTSITASTTPSALATPSVTTGAASAVGATTATLQGTLTGMGGYAACNVWFDYSITIPPYTDSTTPAAQTSPGVFSASINGLTVSTSYHFRADASNTSGTTNGLDVTFTTGGHSAPTMTTNAATGVQLSSAQLNGTVTDDGGASAGVTVWFQYGKTNQYEMGSTPTSAGLFTGGTSYYGLGGLLPSTMYYFRAVGQNTYGITYGNSLTLTTSGPIAPTVVTNAASSIGAVTATLQGTLSTDGGVACNLSFGWDTVAGPPYSHTVVAAPATGSAGTSFSALISGLVVGTTYHFGAIASNAGGTGHGVDATFITVFAAPINFTAIAVSPSTINLSWTSQGDQTFVNYQTGGYPLDRASGIQVYFGSASYASVSSLSAGTTYYFSAWSWKVGDAWTTSNSNAIATTQAANPVGNLGTPPAAPGTSPTTGSSWFNIPDDAIVKNLPLYDVLTGWGTAFSLPPGTFWAIVATLLSVVLGGLALAAFRQAIPAVGVSVITIVLCGLIHMCPLIFAFLIGAIEIGGTVGISSLGGNIMGRERG